MRVRIRMLWITCFAGYAFGQDCAPFESSLIARWAAEGDARDSVGSHDGDLENEAAFGPGKVGEAFLVTDNDYVSIPDALDMRLLSQSAFSLDAWVKPSQYSSNTYMAVTLTKPYYYGLLYSAEQKYFRAHVSNGNSWIYWDAPYELPLGQWTHVAQTWDGSELRIFANGQLVGAGAAGGNADGLTEGPAFIGRWQPRQELFTLNGSIDEVGLYSTALSEQSVRAIYDAGSAGHCGSFSAELIQTGPRCATLLITHSEAIRGGEIGLAYDPGVVTAIRVTPGQELSSAAQIQFQPAAQVHCNPDQATAGLTVGWVNSLSSDEVLAPGKHALFKVCFALAPGAELGACSPLHFVSCLGVAEAPVRNVVTLRDGSSAELETEDGQICILEQLSFRRGDSNTDGALDISDAIVILGCLFGGTPCPTCADAGDTNDDGSLDISDAVSLLNWRFLGGPPPAPPFPECGMDLSEDALDDCESFAPCQ